MGTILHIAHKHIGKVHQDTVAFTNRTMWFVVKEK